MAQSTVRLTDGSWDFSAGIDSSRVTTIQSALNPNGLPRNMLAWLTNGTVRSGGILQRLGWQYRLTARPGDALFQGAFLYEPSFFENPYFIASIGGRIYKITVDDATITDLSAQFNLTNPANTTHSFFVQGEQFLVIQAGDITNPNPTNPLFWDGTTLRRSAGLAGGELPPAGPMCYYQGRIWYANGRIYTAGDIVFGPSGSLQYKFTDSILKVTENPLAVGGDGFKVPDNAGDIRALSYTANLNTNLGQGPLYIFTARQIYSLVVPVTRTDWIAANNNNQPVQTVAQRKYGAVGDRCVVPSNGDLFYQSLEPAIRSLLVSVRNDNQWGNVPISRNENRVLAFNNRGLMREATGIEFDNRLWQAVLPKETPVGVAFQAIIPLDFDLISTLQQQLPPAWEGMYEGLDVLQLFEGDFGGRQRAFSFSHSRVDGTIQLWEFTDFSRFDSPPGQTDNRVRWFFETPAYTWGKEFQMKELDGGEFYLDKLAGTVEMLFEYRVDADPCWRFWTKTSFCAAKSSCESPENPVCYPEEPFCEGYQFPITLPKPNADQCATMMKRPTTIGYQFQVRVTIKGWCRIRGIMLFATERDRAPFEKINCSPNANA